MQAQTVDRSYAGKLLVGLLVLAALTTVLVFCPRHPSPFTEHGAFGAGHGRESFMIGARPRKGAAP